MTIQQAKQEMIDVIIESTETEEEVRLDSHLSKDLGLSSMEVVVLLSDLEHHFGISIPVKRLRHVQLVGDLCDVIIDILTH